VTALTSGPFAVADGPLVGSSDRNRRSRPTIAWRAGCAGRAHPTTLGRVRHLTILGAIAVTLLSAAGTASAAVPQPIPPHVFAPYFQAYLPGDPAEMAEQSGARFQNLAFLETDKPGSCQVYANGVATGPDYVDSAARLRAMGGQLIPSFGGAYAGDNGSARSRPRARGAA